MRFYRVSSVVRSDDGLILTNCAKVYATLTLYFLILRCIESSSFLGLFSPSLSALVELSQPQSLPELHESLHNFQQMLKATSSNIPHEADRLLVCQLEAACSRLQQQQTRTDPVHLVMLVLGGILECLCTLWSGQDVAARTLSGANSLPCLLTVWKLMVDGEESHDGVAVATTLSGTRQAHSIAITVRTVAILAKHQREVKHAILKQAVVVVPLIVRTTVQTLTNSAVENRHQEEKKSEDAVARDDSSAQEQHELAKALFLFIKELTLRAAVKDQTFLYEQLLDIVLEIGCNLQPESATGTLWNWAVSLPQCIAANHSVWSQVRDLWNKQEEANFSGTSEATQRNLSAIVGTVVAACTNYESLPADAYVTQIQKQTWLVPSLLNSFNNENNSTANKLDYRRRCMRTIRCLAATEWGRNFFWKHTDAKFGTAIVQILRSDGVIADNDTRILACQALALLLPSLPADMVQLGPCLETTMIQIIEDADENVDFAVADKLVLAASQALAVSLKCSPWKRGAGCFPPAFFDQILAVLQERVDEPAYHVGFSELFLQLMVQQEGDEDKESTTRIKDISALLVSCPAVLEILAILLSPLVTVPELDEARYTTVQVLTALVNDNHRNKKPMADDENLLTALVNVCLMTNNEGPLKDDAKQLIFALVPEL